MDQKLSGKTMVVTGATSGIGLATAAALVEQGAGVIGVGRSPERCREAVERLRQIHPDAQVRYCVGDLAVQAEVRRLAEQIRAELAEVGKQGLDGLINNAGTFTFRFTPSADGIEMQWAVNHLAAFLLTRELLPALEAARTARVVTVSSDSHYGARIHWKDVQRRQGYNGLGAYGQSKLANILFTLELNRRLGTGSPVRAFAADPGLVKTEIGFKDTPALVRWFWSLRRSGGVPAEIPGHAIAYLAGEPGIQTSQEIYWKDCAPKRPSRLALDARSAQRLWDLSEEMCAAV